MAYPFPDYGSGGRSYAGIGGIGRGPIIRQPQTAPASPLTNQYNLYNTAVKRQAEDYGDIMGSYKNLLSQSAVNNPYLKPSGTYSPQSYEYQPTSNVTSSLSNLQNLSQSGGYTPAELLDLRARGISPIRSIYAGANRDIDRNRTLRGGNAPGYQAAKVKLARELSDQLSETTRKVNADIAERVASGRLSAAPQYASAAGQESALRSQYGRENINAANEAQRFNLMLPLEYGKYNAGVTGNQADLLRGMSSLYGTTPALSSLYGGQALSAAQLQNLINQQGNQGNLQIISQLMRGLG